MAKAVANCKCVKCGKSFDVTAIKRNRREADNFEEWAEANITMCYDCERAEAHEEALKASEGMPELTGSEKQIKWAIDIRAAKTREAETDHFSTAHLALCWKHIVAAKTESRFWIDHRDESAEHICTTLLRTESEIFEAATDTAEQIKADAYAELDEVGQSAVLHHKDSKAEQVNEVRQCLNDIFGDPAITPIMVIAKFSDFLGMSRISPRGLVNSTLRDGKVWDSTFKQWIDRAEPPVSISEIDERLRSNGGALIDREDDGVALHIAVGATGKLLPNIQSPDLAEIFSDFVSYSDLGVTPELSYINVCGPMQEAHAHYLETGADNPYIQACERLAGRVNALRTYYRNHH